MLNNKLFSGSKKILIFMFFPLLAAACNTGSASTQSNLPVSTSGTITASSTAAGTEIAGTYTIAQVQSANTRSKCWTTINGGVYDLTSYINQHPGGAQRIMELCGIDGTQKFIAQHGGQGKPEQELASLKIGTLAQ